MKQILAYDGPLGTVIGTLNTHAVKIDNINVKLDEHEGHIEKIKGTLELPRFGGH